MNNSYSKLDILSNILPYIYKNISSNKIEILYDIIKKFDLLNPDKNIYPTRDLFDIEYGRSLTLDNENCEGYEALEQIEILYALAKKCVHGC